MESSPKDLRIRYTISAFKAVKSTGSSVVAFLDNNQELWGRKLEGVNIIPVGVVRSLSDLIHIIIANEEYFEEMRQQLLELGIEEKRIHIF